MEKMPYQPELERAATMATPSTRDDVRLAHQPAGPGRSELHPSRAAAEDAPSLLAMLTTEEVSRFISPPPTTVEGFERSLPGRCTSARRATTFASASCPRA